MHIAATRLLVVLLLPIFGIVGRAEDTAGKVLLAAAIFSLY